MNRRVLDVSRLPTTVFGHRDPLWWAVMLGIAIESTMLALLGLSYLYIANRTSPFPPAHIGPGIAWIATLELALWIACIYPQHKSSRAAISGRLPAMRRWLIVATLIATWACVVRIWIFALLPFNRAAHAYGSIVWAMLGVQWLHGVTGVIEDLIYVVLLFKGPVEDKHRVDIECTSPMMYFVVAGTALLWAIILLPVLLGGGR